MATKNNDMMMIYVMYLDQHA